MNLSTTKNLFSLFKHFSANRTSELYQQCRGIVKVRLKWVKNRNLDHIIDTETDLKAAFLLKDAIKRCSCGFITARSVADWHKLLGLTVPVLRFLRRYPTLFEEFPHAKYAGLPCFRLTNTALFLDSEEQNIHQKHEIDAVERLCKFLMMMKSRTIPFQSIHSLKWDLGLPDDFDRALVRKYPDYFRVLKAANGTACLGLARWREEFAISTLQKNNESSERGNEYSEFKRGKSTMAFPMNFPRGYGAQTKVKAWMEEFQKLPYISPYEESKQIDPNSELMEKRIVSVLHEILSLTIHKKTKRNYLRSLREELHLPHRFTRIFTRYPGIFYLSLKCKTTTVVLREGYQRGKLVNAHPLALLRAKYYHVMRTGLLYRARGVNMPMPRVEGERCGEGFQEEEVETSDEWCEEDGSDSEDDS